jgi:hypothetical protein
MDSDDMVSRFEGAQHMGRGIEPLIARVLD